MNNLEIISTRKYNNWPSYDLVFEWEDTISNKLNIPLYYETEVQSIINKITKRIGYNGCFALLNNKKKLFLQFEMTAKKQSDIYNRKNIIPIIIDFYLSKDELCDFKKSHNKNPLILISSAEVISFLDKSDINIKYFHLPLSIPDKYQFNPNVLDIKEYDIVLAGRQNPVLEDFFNEYISNNKHITYVYRKMHDNRFYYYTNNDKLLGEFSTRSEYISLLQKSRIGLYATPGIDGGDDRTKGFNQVTPRFLELLSAGCHILARYPKNEDTDFYKLSEFSPNIDSYDKFKDQMDYALNNPIETDKYISYLKKHYTSSRIDLLNQIIINNI